ncbi:MAG: cupin domain-containing protein [Fenollaria massiliensis]
MLAKVLKDEGLIKSINGVNFFHKILKKGDVIDKHNHPDKEIVFAVMKGSFEITIGGEEKHLVKAGEALNFDGTNTISAVALDDSESLVVLVNKE